MIKSNKQFLFNLSILCVAVLLPYIRIAPFAIALMVIIGIINYKHFVWRKIYTKYAILVALPLIIHLLFIWNEPDLINALKPIERLLSLIIFPVVLLGYSSIIKKSLILKWYPILSILLLIGLSVRFVLTSPERIHRYINGIDLHEPGYALANSFGSHGPAINMHLSFIICVMFYNMYKAIIKSNFSLKSKALEISLLVAALILLIIINTRLAIVITFINILLISLWFNLKRFSLKANLYIIAIISLLFVGTTSIYVAVNPAFKEKISTITFAHMDKIGKLDEVENPEVTIFNALVTRVSIWKTAIALGEKYFFIGVGSSQSRAILIAEYQRTNQKFLHQYKFPVHNQYIDYFVRFGIMGVLCVLIYVFQILMIGLKTKNILAIAFFILFASVNLVDDFLIRFDGIAFSGFWISFFLLGLLTKNSHQISN